MKRTKIFMMAALALMTAACSNDDNDFAQQNVEPNGEITITATVSTGDGGETRLMTSSSGSIHSEFYKDEEIAVLFKNGSTDCKRIAKITKVSVEEAEITFTIPADLTDGTSCTLIYPAASADDTGLKEFADVNGTQNGRTNAKMDTRVGTATIINQTESHHLASVSTLEPQYAIFELTMRDMDGSSVTASQVVISDETGVVTTVTPATGMKTTMYVALPKTATTLKFAVTDPDGKKYFNMASDLSLDTKYYRSTVKLATIGDVVLSSGKCAKAGTTGAVAMIAYLGSESECDNGLAIAFENESSTYNWENAKSQCDGLNSSKAIAGGTWRLPSVDDFEYMFLACGGAGEYKDISDPDNINKLDDYYYMEFDETGLNEKLGTDLVGLYWTSDSYDGAKAWSYMAIAPGYDRFSTQTKTTGYQVRPVLAF